MANSSEIIYQGGLMRCCLETLGQHLDSDGSREKGTIIQCRHCTSSMRLDEDGWHWVEKTP